MPTTVNDLLAWWPVAVALLVYAGVAVAAWVAVRRLLPPRRCRAVPWTGLELVAALFLIYFFWVPLFYSVVLETGLGERLYGPDVVALVKVGKDDPDSKLAQTRVGMLVTVIAFPFQVLTILLLLGFGSGTRPYQLGLTANRAGDNVLLGFLAWLVLTPLVLALFGLVRWVLTHLTPGGVSDHPFTQVGEDGLLTAGELALMVFAAIVAAPVLEELIFRGLLQRWLSRRWWGGHVAMGAALLVALPYKSSQSIAPALFVLALVPGYMWAFGKGCSPSAAAVCGTSLLFAAVHSFAWPSPVALFVLALGLGWLAERTQSLVGPIVLHALFNGVACVQLIWEM
ncbi:MAG: CPBP family intramembrane metalloprotease [Planctomycetes bacterium]|nr:CPBP family intramembrane metalloprotease [Planctomycetota bacterium]